MLKKNEVIEILNQGGHVSLAEIYRTATVYDVAGNRLDTCRYDTAEKIGTLDGFENVRIGSAWNYHRQVRNPEAVEAAREAAADELASITEPGTIELVAKANLYIGREIKKGSRYLVTVYGNGVHSQPGNAYGTLYDFDEHAHAVSFEIVSRPEQPQEAQEDTETTEEENTMTDKLNALKAHLIENEGFTAEELETETEDTTYNENWNTFEIAGREYLVLTEDEADDRARTEILGSLWAFNQDFILHHTEFYNTSTEAEDDVFCASLEKMQGQLCESANEIVRALIADLDAFVTDAIDADGRGHFISWYDGEEIESGAYFIYRTN